MIYIYKILGFFLIPLIKINILIRVKKNKEDKFRYKERYGLSKYSLANNRKVIWIHAASIGELKSADYFIKNYSIKFNLLVTTTTLAAAKYAKDNYGNIIIHQFAPLDISIWVNRFIKKWDPVKIIWIESDLWPITLNLIKNYGIEAILLNHRLSPRSQKRWLLYPSFYNNLLETFSKIFAQSKLDYKRIKTLTHKEIKYIGNLKFTNTNNFYDKKIDFNN